MLRELDYGRGPRGRLAMRRSPRPCRPVRRVLIGGAAILVVAAVVVVVHVLRPAHGIAPPAPLLSDSERTSRADIVRDCGYSQPLPVDPSVSLWLFCDTDVYAFTAHGRWRLSSIIGGSTAAKSPVTAGAVPGDLSELIPPGEGVRATPGQDGPARFLPAPSGLKTAAGLDCDLADNAYPASWPTGVTADPAQGADILITFNNYCVTIGTGGLLPEGFGLAEYDPAANTFRAVVTVCGSGRIASVQEERCLLRTGDSVMLAMGLLSGEDAGYSRGDGGGEDPAGGCQCSGEPVLPAPWVERVLLAETD